MLANDHIHQSMEEVKPKIASCSNPLYSLVGKGRPELYGSSVYVEVGGNVFLVTAAHVVSEIIRTGGNVYVGGGRLTKVESDFICTSTNGNDCLDLAFTQIEIADSGVKENGFVSLDSTCYQREFKNPDYYIAYGYPCSKNGARFADTVAKHVVANGFTYGHSEVRDKSYKINGMNKDFHVGLIYKHGKLLGGERVNPPSPIGLSGGGCWVIPDSFSSEVFLAGIFIEKHGPHIYATKIDHVVKFIMENMRE